MRRPRPTDPGKGTIVAIVLAAAAAAAATVARLTTLLGWPRLAIRPLGALVVRRP